LRDFREHHSRQGSLQDGLKDIFYRQTHISDPDILKFIEKSRPKKLHTPISPEVQALLVFSNDSDDLQPDSDGSDMQVN
jgi:hypothetical protein